MSAAMSLRSVGRPLARFIEIRSSSPAMELRPLRGGRIRTALTLVDQGAIGLSGCPSPAPADAGLPRLLAVGSVTRSELQRSQVTLRLRGSGAFSGPLGGGRATGDLAVVLRRSADR